MNQKDKVSLKLKNNNKTLCFRTNLPTVTMEFMDFPFINSKSFVTAGEVLKYLEDYCDHFNLKKHIKVKFASTLKILISTCKKSKLREFFNKNL